MGNSPASGLRGKPICRDNSLPEYSFMNLLQFKQLHKIFIQREPQEIFCHNNFCKRIHSVEIKNKY